ncbi:hypothetical protein SK128_013192 [Halocaridina rubra]|uniref:Uncharacterized protein n=1 Tax=Halocaridina rubra TaxID=373956 RepID=A0AAN8WXV1_HALRR
MVRVPSRHYVIRNSGEDREFPVSIAYVSLEATKSDLISAGECTIPRLACVLRGDYNGYS